MLELTLTQFVDEKLVVGTRSCDPMLRLRGIHSFFRLAPANRVDGTEVGVFDVTKFLVATI